MTKKMAIPSSVSVSLGDEYRVALLEPDPLSCCVIGANQLPYKQWQNDDGSNSRSLMDFKIKELPLC